MIRGSSASANASTSINPFAFADLISSAFAGFLLSPSTGFFPSPSTGFLMLVK